MTCPACGTVGPDYHVRGPHLVQRQFTDWSGTWRNSVVCDGVSVPGDPIPTTTTTDEGHTP